MNSAKQTILIVDDIQFNRQFLKNVLQDEYNVICADSGKMAIEIVMSQPIDLVLLDIIMPTMDGYEICRWIKTNPGTKDIPVIFVSIKDDPEDQTTGFSLGAIDYITKNTDASIIKARVKNHLELKKQRDMLIQESINDFLTGIPNRRYFDEILATKWRQALRDNEYLSIQLIDIDFFKNYNDFYGHIEGDRCLKLVADALKKSLLRPLDIVARYGGEEFIVLLPLTPRDGAIKVAKRIQENISALNITHQLSSVNDFVTVSIGIATIKPEENLDATILIKRADYGLYKAKNEGRNRFIAIE
ncbi:Protein-glutamate methylesterase/protein-glutamine glutaminase [Sporomusa rhizae]|uniref:diguanylate cyclase n=1 Tax=Sporomusa rhizae TaxID=357999 RepID=UPI00352B2AB1